MDTFNKIMFELYVNEMYDSIYFEVADEGLIDYLVNKYPQIQLCLHENYTMFHSENEPKNLSQYIKTKFFRALLGIKKVTQHCPPSVEYDSPTGLYARFRY